MTRVQKDKIHTARHAMLQATIMAKNRAAVLQETGQDVEAALWNHILNEIKYALDALSNIEVETLDAHEPNAVG